MSSDNQPLYDAHWQPDEVDEETGDVERSPYYWDVYGPDYYDEPDYGDFGDYCQDYPEDPDCWCDEEDEGEYPEIPMWKHNLNSWKYHLITNPLTRLKNGPLWPVTRRWRYWRIKCRAYMWQWHRLRGDNDDSIPF